MWARADGSAFAALLVSPPQTGLMLHQAAGCRLALLCWPSHSQHPPQAVPGPEGWLTRAHAQPSCWTQGLPSHCCLQALRQLLCCASLLPWFHPLHLLQRVQQLMQQPAGCPMSGLRSRGRGECPWYSCSAGYLHSEPYASKGMSSDSQTIDFVFIRYQPRNRCCTLAYHAM